MNSYNQIYNIIEKTKSVADIQRVLNLIDCSDAISTDQRQNLLNFLSLMVNDGDIPLICKKWQVVSGRHFPGCGCENTREFLTTTSKSVPRFFEHEQNDTQYDLNCVFMTAIAYAVAIFFAPFLL